jgi:NAD(P)-dependent dehydrogenase (short-subunit alcohol dehydrogenase family)
VHHGAQSKTLDEANIALDGQVLAVQADISNLDDLDHLYAQVKEQFGRIDILFANAAVPGLGVPLENMTPEIFDLIFSVN